MLRRILKAFKRVGQRDALSETKQANAPKSGDYGLANVPTFIQNFVTETNSNKTKGSNSPAF